MPQYFVNVTYTYAIIASDEDEAVDLAFEMYNECPPRAKDFGVIVEEVKQ